MVTPPEKVWMVQLNAIELLERVPEVITIDGRG
jgi:hypothetical protein